MSTRLSMRPSALVLLLLLAFALCAPMLLYPVFLMKLMCFALFASAFNLLVGYVGLLAFGHAVFFGSAAYMTGWLLKFGGATPEVAILAGACAAHDRTRRPNTGNAVRRGRPMPARYRNCVRSAGRR